LNQGIGLFEVIQNPLFFDVSDGVSIREGESERSLINTKALARYSQDLTVVGTVN